MRSVVRYNFAVLAMVLTLAGETAATTWFPKEVTCPLCQTKNEFSVIGSYGSYIYRWPSKFQYIFWPLIDSHVLYSCKGCRLTCFMWDFEKIPADKHEAIRKQLDGVTLSQPTGEYFRIPMTERLKAAEGVYSVLGRDDDFWCQFYRVVGYHSDEENKPKEAEEARKKALALAEKMLAKKENEGIRKEILLISGAMRHFLKDDQAALKDFNEALKLKYESKDKPQEQSANIDQYLTQLLNEYVLEVQGSKKQENPGRAK
ncbi:MAG: hypothetical protein AB1696_09170 [Planctomycetota bacterium]